MPDNNVFKTPIIGIDMNEEGTSAFIGIVREIVASLENTDYRCVAVSSATDGEGKDGVALNLACASAMGGRKTLVIDCDIKNRVLTSLSQDGDDAGLTDILLGVNSNSKVFRKLDTNIDIMFTGKPVDNYDELMTGARMQKLITVLGKKYDFVVLNLPPVCDSEITATTASFTNGLLMVVGQGVCEKSDIKKAADRLSASGIGTSWIVMNDKANLV